MKREILKRQVESIIEQYPTASKNIAQVHMLVVKNYYSDYQILKSEAPLITDVAILMK